MNSNFNKGLMPIANKTVPKNINKAVCTTFGFKISGVLFSIISNEEAGKEIWLVEKVSRYNTHIIIALSRLNKSICFFPKEDIMKMLMKHNINPSNNKMFNLSLNSL